MTRIRIFETGLLENARDGALGMWFRVGNTDYGEPLAASPAAWRS